MPIVNKKPGDDRFGNSSKKSRSFAEYYYYCVSCMRYTALQTVYTRRSIFRRGNRCRDEKSRRSITPAIYKSSDNVRNDGVPFCRCGPFFFKIYDIRREVAFFFSLEMYVRRVRGAISRDRRVFAKKYIARERLEKKEEALYCALLMERALMWRYTVHSRQ